jgi:hypothetical protein
MGDVADRLWLAYNSFSWMIAVQEMKARTSVAIRGPRPRRAA